MKCIKCSHMKPDFHCFKWDHKIMKEGLDHRDVRTSKFYNGRYVCVTCYNELGETI